MYYLATYLGGGEGWALEENEDLQAILEYIQQGNTHGKFKILRELKLQIEDE